jgi:hypothetical protein
LASLCWRGSPTGDRRSPNGARTRQSGERGSRSIGSTCPSARSLLVLPCVYTLGTLSADREGRAPADRIGGSVGGAAVSISNGYSARSRVGTRQNGYLPDPRRPAGGRPRSSNFRRAQGEHGSLGCVEVIDPNTQGTENSPRSYEPRLPDRRRVWVPRCAGSTAPAALREAVRMARSASEGNDEEDRQGRKTWRFKTSSGRRRRRSP